MAPVLLLRLALLVLLTWAVVLCCQRRLVAALSRYIALSWLYGSSPGVRLRRRIDRLRRCLLVWGWVAGWGDLRGGSSRLLLGCCGWWVRFHAGLPLCVLVVALGRRVMC